MQQLGAPIQQLMAFVEQNGAQLASLTTQGRGSSNELQVQAIAAKSAALEQQMAELAAALSKFGQQVADSADAKRGTEDIKLALQSLQQQQSSMEHKLAADLQSLTQIVNTPPRAQVAELKSMLSHLVSCSLLRFCFSFSADRAGVGLERQTRATSRLSH